MVAPKPSSDVVSPSSLLHDLSTFVSEELGFDAGNLASSCVFCKQAFGSSGPGSWTRSGRCEIKVLHCLHSSCGPCLEECLRNQKEVMCPICDASTAEQNPRKYLCNFAAHQNMDFRAIEESRTLACDECVESCAAVMYCHVCVRSLCEECSEHHRRCKSTSMHRLVTLREQQEHAMHRAAFCAVHHDNLLEFFCEACDVMCCRECVLNEHENHPYKIPAGYLIDRQKEIVRDQLQQLRILSRLLQERHQLLSRAINDFDQQLETSTANLGEVYADVQGALEERRSKLLGDIDGLRAEHLVAHEQKHSDLSALMASMWCEIDFMEKALARGTDIEVLLLRGKISTKIRPGNDLADGDAIHPFRDIKWRGSSLACLVEDVGSMAAVQWPRSRVISGVAALPTHAAHVQQHRVAEAVEKIADNLTESVPKGLTDGMARLKKARSTNAAPAAATGSAAAAGMKNVSGGRVRISLLEAVGPISHAQERASPSRLRQPAVASPLGGRSTPRRERRVISLDKAVVESRAAAEEKCGVPCIEESNAAHHITHTANDRPVLAPEKSPVTAAIACGGAPSRASAKGFVVNGGVHARSNTEIMQSGLGHHIATVGGTVEGAHPGSFQSPCGMAIGPSHIYIADTLNHRIQVFDRSSYTLRGLLNLSDRSGTVELRDPSGLCLTEDRRLAVVEYGVDRILSVELSEDSLEVLAIRPLAENKLYGPFGVGVSNGRVIVADSCNHRCLALDPFGEVLFEFGTRGSRPGEFEFPECVAAFSDGSIAVSDKDNHRVQVFDEFGRFKHFVPSYWSAEIKYSVTPSGWLCGPMGMCCDALDRLYICDCGSSRIQIFTRGGQWLWSSDGFGATEFVFRSPTAIQIDECGTVYVASDHMVQVFSCDPGVK